MAATVVGKCKGAVRIPHVSPMLSQLLCEGWGLGLGMGLVGGEGLALMGHPAGIPGARQPMAATRYQWDTPRGSQVPSHICSTWRLCVAAGYCVSRLVFPRCPWPAMCTDLSAACGLYRTHAPRFAQRRTQSFGLYISCMQSQDGFS